MSLETILNFSQHKAILVTERNVWFIISGRDGRKKYSSLTRAVCTFSGLLEYVVYSICFMSASNIRSISQRVSTLASKNLVIIVRDLFKVN